MPLCSLWRRVSIHFESRPKIYLTGRFTTHFYECEAGWAQEPVWTLRRRHRSLAHCQEPNHHCLDLHTLASPHYQLIYPGSCMTLFFTESDVRVGTRFVLISIWSGSDYSCCRLGECIEPHHSDTVHTLLYFDLFVSSTSLIQSCMYRASSYDMYINQVAQDFRLYCSLFSN